MNPAIRRSLCAACDLECPVRATIDHTDPAACCPVEKWVDAGWRQRQAGPRAPMPPVKTQLAHAAGALRRAAQAVVKREPLLATAAEAEARREICASCPDLVNGRCARCGCFYKAKIKLATERCPLGKWPVRDVPAPPPRAARGTPAKASPPSPPLVGEAPAAS